MKLSSGTGTARTFTLACAYISLLSYSCEAFISSVHQQQARVTPHPLSARPLPQSAYDAIENGKIAIVPGFLSREEIKDMRDDAEHLYSVDHAFSTDALASYGQNGKYDPTKERAVTKLPAWKNQNLGDSSVRKHLESTMAHVRQDLADNLQRPGLTQGSSVNMYGTGSTEISYTRFGPGASLKRHVDEHHEELKGPAGWSKPTRRSLSWLVYLNDYGDEWNADRYGGSLRTYQRTAPRMSHKVGARRDGDLQIGWLRPTATDPVERPVYMTSQYDSGDGSPHTCAMYVLPDSGDERDVEYITTKPFSANPTLYLGNSEWMVQNTLLDRRRSPELARRFQLIEQPKSPITDLISQSPAIDSEQIVDVPCSGGTLVVFDSVSLPHEVLPTMERARWATSGWMHEDQQSIHTHPDYHPFHISV